MCGRVKLIMNKNVNAAVMFYVFNVAKVCMLFALQSNVAVCKC